MKDLIKCINHRILFAEGAYGVEHGPPRRAAFDFLLELGRGHPEYYDYEFLEYLGGMTEDYVFNIMEGVRRLFPYLDKTAPVNALRKIPPTPADGRKTFWREPATFRMESKRGFRIRTAIRELQMEKRREREDTKLAFQRYMTKRRSEPRKGGYETEQEEPDEKEAVGEWRCSIFSRREEESSSTAREEKKVSIRRSTQ